MSDPFYFFSYFIAMCISVRYIADNRSYIGVKISDKCRYLLLIFSFKEIILVHNVSTLYFIKSSAARNYSHDFQ